MHNTLHVTESLPRGNCVLALADAIAARTQAVSSREQITPPASRFAYAAGNDVSISMRRSPAVTFSRENTCVFGDGFTYVDFTVIYEPLEIRRLCRPIEKELPQCN